MSPKKQCDQYVYVCLFCFLFFCFTEIEAKEACDWLRAAGFPQYAQLYEGNAHTHTHTEWPAFTQLRRFTQSLAPPNIFAHSFWFSFSLTPCLIFFFHHLYFSLSFHHPSISVSLSSGPFYFQASVPVQREGSWERPCYHYWDSHSFSFSLLSSTFPPQVTHHSSSSHPSVKVCILLLLIHLSLSFACFSITLSSLLLAFPPFWKTYKHSFMYWSLVLIKLRHKQEMAPVI